MEEQPFVTPEYFYCVRVNGVVTYTSLDGFKARSQWLYQRHANPDAHVTMEDIAGTPLEDNRTCILCHQPLTPGRQS